MLIFPSPSKPSAFYNGKFCHFRFLTSMIQGHGRHNFKLAATVASVLFVVPDGTAESIASIIDTSVSLNTDGAIAVTATSTNPLELRIPRRSITIGPADSEDPFADAYIEVDAFAAAYVDADEPDSGAMRIQGGALFVDTPVVDNGGVVPYHIGFIGEVEVEFEIKTDASITLSYTMPYLCMYGWSPSGSGNDLNSGVVTRVEAGASLSGPVEWTSNTTLGIFSFFNPESDVSETFEDRLSQRVTLDLVPGVYTLRLSGFGNATKRFHSTYEPSTGTASLRGVTLSYSISE